LAGLLVGLADFLKNRVRLYDGMILLLLVRIRRFMFVLRGLRGMGVGCAA
jgi:hypothetical protein